MTLNCLLSALANAQRLEAWALEVDGPRFKSLRGPHRPWDLRIQACLSQLEKGSCSQAAAPKALGDSSDGAHTSQHTASIEVRSQHASAMKSGASVYVFNTIWFMNDLNMRCTFAFPFSSAPKPPLIAPASVSPDRRPLWACLALCLFPPAPSRSSPWLARRRVIGLPGPLSLRFRGFHRWSHHVINNSLHWINAAWEVKLTC